MGDEGGGETIHVFTSRAVVLVILVVISIPLVLVQLCGPRTARERGCE